MDNLEKLNAIIDLLDEEKVTSDDLKEVFDAIVILVEELKFQLENKIEDSKNGVLSNVNDIAYAINEIEIKTRELVNNSDKNSLLQIKELSQRINNEIRRVESNIPELPDTSHLELKMADLENRFLDTKQQNEIEELRNEIELLKTELKDSKVNRGLTIGGNRPLHVFNNGVEVAGAVTELNFVNPTSITTTGKSQRRVNITTGTGSGSGYTKDTPTGDVDSSNTTYTVVAEPAFVVADGITYFDGAGYTYSALSIEMDNPPTQYIRYFY